MINIFKKGAALLILLMAAPCSMANPAMESESITLTRDACTQLQKSPFYSAPAVNQVTAVRSAIMFRGNEVGDRYRYGFNDGQSIRVDIVQQSGRPGRVVSEVRNSEDQPVFFVAMDGSCEIQQARRLLYLQGRSHALQILDGNLDVIQTEALNPVADIVVSDPASGQLTVAMIDAGVNYLLPQISTRMARGSDGEILGFDFWDMDARPFDAHPVGSPFFVQRHGTRTASLLLDQAPAVKLVSYRYPRPAMARFEQLIAHAHSLGVRIVGMPLGSNRLQDWIAFEKAALAHPEMLFIVSAGNNGRDIDLAPVYPAAMDIPNMIVVTSADDLGRPAERTNWGKRSVDYMLPAERVQVTYFNGNSGLASGSSYAVSRMVAMAAGLLIKHPGSSVIQLIDSITGFALNGDAAEFAKLGYIPDPLVVDGAVGFSRLAQWMLPSTSGDALQLLQLDVLVLDDQWSLSEVQQVVNQAGEILSQCGVGIAAPVFYTLDGSAYLQYLDTGSSHTLLTQFASQTGSDGLRLVLATDTRMQVQFDAEAFGGGNTRTRPWLSGSVWVMHGARDLGITIAHELFHVMANDGRHPADSANLMSAETRVDNVQLTPAQCQQAMEYFLH